MTTATTWGGEAPMLAGLTVDRRVTAMLDRIGVDLDASTAHCGAHEVEARRNPAQLRARLAGAIYSDLHAGRMVTDAGALRPRTMRDPAVEAALSRVVPHHSAPFDATIVPATDPAATAGPPGDLGRTASVAVDIGEAVVWVPRAAVRPEADARVTVDLPALWPALSPGFLMVTGPHGRVRARDRIRRIYLHVRDVRRAPAVWRAALEALRDLGVPYRAKVLSDGAGYPRRDAVVVYHRVADGQVPAAVRDAVAGLDGMGDEVSTFARPLGPGIATACEPDDRRPGMKRVSFGQHRALALATAVLRHAADGGPLDAAVAAALRAANIDPADVSENLGGTT